MESRTNAIKKIEEIVHPIGNTAGITGSWHYRFLNNTMTLNSCQVMEAIDGNGKCIPMDRHIHKGSKEIFYQVSGETIFEDGFVLKAGEIHIIEPGKAHSPYVTKGGSVIVIIHPVDEELRKYTQQ